MWYLIVSIPDLCTLTYSAAVHSKAKALLFDIDKEGDIFKNTMYMKVRKRAKIRN